MKRIIFSIYIFFALFCPVSFLFGIDENARVIGALSGWNDFEAASGLVAIPDVRPFPVLALSSEYAGVAGIPPDGYLAFDEGNPDRFVDQANHYAVSVSPELGAAGSPWVRRGFGAARFSSSQSQTAEGSARAEPLVLRPTEQALFAPGSRVGDFTLEFWLCPANPVNGEQVLSWSSTFFSAGAGSNYQRIRCVISKNRLEWTFTNFFVDAGGMVPNDLKTISLTGAPFYPKTWSHHLIRFDSNYGILEYLVDGRQESLVHTTSSRREGGDVYTPLIGEDCGFTLGSRFTGFIDEFRIYPCYLENPVLTKYQSQGGRAESRTLDLGAVNTRLLRLEAGGGRVFGGAANQSEYSGSGNFRFADHSEVRFYVRFSDVPYQWNMPWIPVAAGADFPESFSGRYVQIAVEFFPSGDGETSPYLEEVRLVYLGIEPPPPPGLVTAVARDGAVDLSWRDVADSNLGGYLVYFGASREEYFGGRGSFSSPLDVGERTSIRIEGLQNGTLYYFAVASYDKGFHEPGAFSRETAARPQREFQTLPRNR